MTNKNDTRIGVLLSTTNKRKPVQKLLGYFISFLVFYYSILVFIKNRNHQSVLSLLLRQQLLMMVSKESGGSNMVGLH
ncbi:hypothetical protein PSTT_06297 [Puccinia striiformis]|uniref:Uncharacterized protein n=1 Tax=Puccinia striiformis TaxID=27350 RepID=A0A2S4VKH3_9BASI|nr:hypothetical protein PSTT_06297 [Puccinia striiformis]